MKELTGTSRTGTVSTMTEERKAAERLAFKFLCLLLVIACLVWIIPWVWDMFSPFIIAIPLAAVLQPVISFLQKKLKFRRGLASLVVVLVAAAVVLLALKKRKEA